MSFMDGFNESIIREVGDHGEVILRKITLESSGAVVEPLVIPGLDHRNIVEISIGWQHSMALVE